MPILIRHRRDATHEIAKVVREIGVVALVEPLPRKVAVSAELCVMAKQVAHYIRSPIAAVSIAEQGLSELPEEAGLLVRTSLSRTRDSATVYEHILKVGDLWIYIIGKIVILSDSTCRI